jgi:hypothetical protein
MNIILCKIEDIEFANDSRSWAYSPLYLRFDQERDTKSVHSTWSTSLVRISFETLFSTYVRVNGLAHSRMKTFAPTGDRFYCAKLCFAKYVCSQNISAR